MTKFIGFLLILLSIIALLVAMEAHSVSTFLSMTRGEDLTGLSLVFVIIMVALAFASFYFAVRFFRRQGVRMSAELIGGSYAALFALNVAGIFPPNQPPMSFFIIGLEYVGILLGLGVALAGLTVSKTLVRDSDEYH